MGRGRLSARRCALPPSAHQAASSSCSPHDRTDRRRASAGWTKHQLRSAKPCHCLARATVSTPTCLPQARQHGSDLVRPQQPVARQHLGRLHKHLAVVPAAQQPHQYRGMQAVVRQNGTSGDSGGLTESMATMRAAGGSSRTVRAAHQPVSSYSSDAVSRRSPTYCQAR